VSWQPIETSPKDGSWFLGVTRSWFDGKQPLMLQWTNPHPYLGGRQFLVDWDGDSYSDVTVWMPLPAPPSSLPPQ